MSMKARMFAAAGMGLVLLSAISLTPINAASAEPATVSFGSRTYPGNALAGGSRFSGVSQFYPQGKVVKVRPTDTQCSVGVPWRLANGTRGFLTAGHCVSHGTLAQLLKSSPQSSLVTATFGARVGSRSPKNGTTFGPHGTLPGTSGDLGFVASSIPVYNHVWVGPPHWTNRLQIKSWTSRGGTPGDHLCYSGFTSGSICEFKVGSAVTSYRDSYTGAVVTGVAQAIQTSGQGCGAGGDSGGIVFRMQSTGNTVVAVGILSGGGPKVVGCSMFYTPLSAAVARFGGGPIIS